MASDLGLNRLRRRPKKNGGRLTALPSIRTTCTPRDDVLEGGLSDDHFAAQLDQIVRDPAGYPVYGDPDQFFAATYPTEGLRLLLESTFGRMSGHKTKASEHGVMRFETSFGGGKTHGLIAVYHLAQGARPKNLDEFMDPSILPDSCQVAAVVADSLDAVAGAEFDGHSTLTMWGAIAAQLGDEAWSKLAINDVERSAPSKTAWVEIFEAAPTVVIIDEIAQHLRALASSGLEDARRQAEAVPVFLKNLFEAASEVDTARVIITLASGSDAFSSETEQIAEALADVAGQGAVAEAESVMSRFKGSIKPAQDDEIGLILKRRLFADVDTDAAGSVALAYRGYYEELIGRNVALSGGADQPTTYAESIESFYPFHPELIRVLDKRLGTIPNFQRARGALKLLAEAVSALWQQDVDTEIINVADLPTASTDVLASITSGIGKPEFEQVAQADFAGSGSHAAQVDRDRYATTSAYATRACRTVFAHSLESTTTTGAGVTDIHVGTLQFGDDPDIVIEALNTVEQSAWHLAYDGARYRFQVEPNARKIIAEEKKNVPNAEVTEKLRHRIESMFPNQGPVRVHHFPAGAGDIADRDSLRLVVMHHDDLSVTSASATPTPGELVNMLDRYGTAESLRTYRNSVVFLVADADEIENMRDLVRFDLAASRITSDAGRMGQYSADVAKQLQRLSDQGGLQARIAITRCYKHLYYPKNDKPNGHLRHHELPTRAKAEVEKAQTSVIQSVLEEVGKIRTKPLAPEFVERLIGFPGEQPIPTKDVADAFWKDHNADIILNATYITDALSNGVRNGLWLYYDATADRAWDSTPPSIRIAADAYIGTSEQIAIGREPTWDDVRNVLARAGGEIDGTDLRAELEKILGEEPTKSAVTGVLVRAAKQSDRGVVVVEGAPTAAAKALPPSSIDRTPLDRLTILTPSRATEIGMEVTDPSGPKTWRIDASGPVGQAFQTIRDKLADLGDGKAIQSVSVLATLDAGEGTEDIKSLGAALGQLPRLSFTVDAEVFADFEGLADGATIRLRGEAADYQRIETHLLAFLDKASALNGGLTIRHESETGLTADAREWEQLIKVITGLKPGEVQVEVSGQ